MTNEYNVNSIKALSDREHVRLRPSMYIGNSNIAGLNQLIYEICDNSVDEFLAGYGNVIDVHVYKDCSVRIKDFGRGVPCALTKDAQGNDINSLTLAFSRLMAGGKYNQQSYSISSGTFGIGSSVVNFCSSFFHVTVCRDGKIFQQKFEKGVPVTDVEIIGTTALDEFGKEVTGTEIYYKPDPEIFTQTLQPGNEVRTRLMELAVLNSGLTINYVNDLTKTNETFQYNNGIINYLKEVVNNKKLLFEQPFYIKDTSTIDNKNVQCELAFIYDDEVESSSSIRSFVNNINTYMGGTHLNGFREAIKTVLNEFGIKNKLIKEPLELKYYLDGFYGVISLKMSNPSFEGQTKIKLNNPEVENIVVSIVKKYFNTVKDENIKNILTTIVLRSVHVKEAEIAARKARIEKRAAIKVTKQALPIQLADCVNAGTGKYAELFIAEGNSAHGAIKQARDPITMAALPLRGKILNTEKASFDQFIKSPAIQNIITALGTGFGKHFDINKLRYDKIIMACDADVDGYHIRALIITFIYNYMRDLITQGHLYAAIPPLFKVIYKNKPIYLQDDIALNKWKAQHKNDTYEVQRFKGLGEMNPDELWQTILNPVNRTFKQITIDDAEEAEKMLSVCMGSEVAPRRQFIEDNAYKVELK